MTVYRVRCPCGSDVVVWWMATYLAKIVFGYKCPTCKKEGTTSIPLTRGG